MDKNSTEYALQKLLAKQHTYLLRDARYTLGAGYIDGLLRAPLNIACLNSHSTGCQILIEAGADGMDAQQVWFGSIWYSPAYEFNDERHVLGIQPGYEAVDPMIKAMFQKIAFDLDDYYKREAQTAVELEARAALNHDEQRAAYLKMLGV